MITTRLKYGIPDVDLTLSCSGSVNPSCFAGHQLVVLFLPKDPRQQIAEFEAYDKLADQLSKSDAWFIVVGDQPKVRDDTKTPVALDPEDRAWQAFQEVAGGPKLDRSIGAVFFFTRGGAFHRMWSGCGHAGAVVQELLTRS